MSMALARAAFCADRLRIMPAIAKLASKRIRKAVLMARIKALSPGVFKRRGLQSVRTASKPSDLLVT